MDKFHNKELPHLIYAILWEDDGDEFAFIGKTTTTDTKALLRRHLRGEVSVTKRVLHGVDWEDSPPQLIVLHSLVCTGAEAYRYILCYIRLYEDFRFMTIAYRGTDNQAYDMFPHTKQLYEKLKETVTREFLLTGITAEKPKKEAMHKKRKEPMEQLNVRLNASTLCAFQRFCNNLKITQREGFVHLMHMADQDALSEDPVFIEQRETIARQKKRIKELESKLQTESRGQKADAKLKKEIADMKRLIKLYMDLVVDEISKPLLQISPYKTSKEAKSYQYPKSAGETLLELHSLYYGGGTYPALFVCGWDLMKKTTIKLRYYPKEDYIGCGPKSKYAVEKAQWLVSYQPSEGEMMDLVAAFPLPLCEEYEDDELLEQGHSSSDKKALDELIGEINADPSRWNEITYLY